ncbi:MAG TPA: tRNA guanosine(34) transglycosylase Tgt [Alphaproteobacteria bacterium]|nr:tRNA guanosine(34) transglycosylase Tgt [Alphaproteobacteria bacterium]
MPRPDYPNFAFTIDKRAADSRARLGRLRTPHGTLATPNFIFCGTKASLKGVTPDQARAVGTDIILSNTYHLMIQPGTELIERMGGIHRFMGWDGPMLTDSGGFQIFSMGHGSVADEIKGRRQTGRAETLTKITEEGAKFRSYLDGSPILLTPERSILQQRQIGADLIVQFDECTPFHVEKEYTARSMRLSQRWGDRSLAEFIRLEDDPRYAGRQAMYGVVQGGVYEDLRRESAAYTADRPFFGTAVGGSLGGTKQEMYEVVAMTMPMVHPDRPVHLLGIGGIQDIFNGVRQGIDTFDCVSPTRIARHGWAIIPGVAGQRLNIRNARFRQDGEPLDAACGCPACAKYSRAYLHHLFKAGELLAMELVSLHNIAQMNRLLRDIRSAIAADTLGAAERFWLGDEAPADGRV